jgi:retinol dehydrogenase 12
MNEHHHHLSRGQVALITGANTGIGRCTALALAREGIQVFLAGKSEEKTQPVIDQIYQETGQRLATWLPLDLADFASVRHCADLFLATDLHLNLLINNAGLGGVKGLTRDGFEMAFGVNHLGHFLLTQLLLPRLLISKPARIVTVASRAHRLARGIPWESLRQPGKSLGGIQEYAVSKLCNLLFSAELSMKLADNGLSTYAVHPGVVASDFWRAVPAFIRPIAKLRAMKTSEEGAQTTLYCALDAPLTETGLYYSDSKVTTPTAMAQDLTLAAELWEKSLAWCELKE